MIVKQSLSSVEIFFGENTKKEDIIREITTRFRLEFSVQTRTEYSTQFLVISTPVPSLNRYSRQAIAEEIERIISPYGKATFQWSAACFQIEEEAATALFEKLTEIGEVF